MGGNNKDRNQKVKARILLNHEIASHEKRVTDAVSEPLAELDSTVEFITRALETAGHDERDRLLTQKRATLETIARIKANSESQKINHRLDVIGRYQIPAEYDFKMDPNALIEVVEDEPTEPTPEELEAEAKAADDLAALRDKQAKGTA